MDNHIGAKYAEKAFFLMNANTFSSCHTRETKAASYNGRVTCGAAACSQYALSNQHAMHIIGAGFRTYQHDWSSSFTQLFCAVGIKDSFAASSARRGIQAFGQQSSFLFGLLFFRLIEAWQQ